MRRMLALILAVLLLTGCAAFAPTHSNPSPVAGGEPVGRQGNLWYIPNETVESMELRQLLGTGDDLLLCGSGKLILLSGENLSLRAETTLETGDRAYVQVLEEGVGIADPGLGTVTVLDASLNCVTVHAPEPTEDSWLMGMDGQTLYTVCDAGVRMSALPQGQEQQLLQSQKLLPYAQTREGLIFAAIGTRDLVTRWYTLELDGGTVTELEAPQKLALKEGLLPLDRDCFLQVEGRELMLYGADGSFLSRCTLPGGGDDRCGRDFIWSDRWQGWFFLDHHRGETRLMFWDPAVETEGDSIDITPETVPAGEILDEQLYDRAAALSAQYGLDIRIAERSIRNYDSYTAQVLTDPEVTAQALDTLESALAAYPADFFRQLGFSDVETIRIEIVDGLKVKADADKNETSAFAQERDDHYLLVFNARRIQAKMLYHEISHIIDKRLEWDAKLREDALYSEEGWMALQPEGFEYAGSYTNVPDSVKQFYDSGYFVRDYSCVSASEDRAMTMEKAMLGEQAVFDENPHLMPKLRYYCACIRDSFDTTDWPETTRWEQLLPKT